MSSIGELAAKYEQLIREKKSAAQQEKDINEQISSLEEELLEEMVNSGLPMVKTESGMTLYRRNETFVGKADGVTTEALCKEMAQHPQTRDLVALNYNANSLRSRYKEITQSEDTLPESLRNMLKITTIPKIGYRAS